jgi:transcription elongation factor B subunit 1
MSGDGSATGGYVRLLSGDGHCFTVERKCAVQAGTIKAMLEGAFAESAGEVKFPEISAFVLEKVIQYLHYKMKYTNSKVPIPEFHVEPEYALDLLMAANYLDC